MTPIQLSDHFTYKRLLRFTVPGIITAFFSNLLNVVDDGLFVSNFVGKDAFVALNIMAPILTLFMALAYMLASGVNARISGLLGEGKLDEARNAFSSLIYFAAVMSVCISAIGMLLIRPYLNLMGASGAVLENCIKYSNIAFPSAFIFVVSPILQSLLITAERPVFAMTLTIISGACNIVFDILLMVIFPLGITGAILATTSGPLVSGLIALIYFVCTKTNKLRLKRTRVKWAEIRKMSTLGISQLITNMSISIVSMVFNYQLVKYNGNNGVAASMISFARTMLFQIGAVVLLPLFMGLNGIWLAPVIAEIPAFVMSVMWIEKTRRLSCGAVRC